MPWLRSHRQNEPQSSGLLAPESLWVSVADFAVKPHDKRSAGFHGCSSPRRIKQECLSSIKHSCKEHVGVIIGRHPGKGKNTKKKLFREDEVSCGRRASGARRTGPTCSLALDHPGGAQPPRQQLGFRRPAARAGSSSNPGPRPHPPLASAPLATGFGSWR